MHRSSPFSSGKTAIYALTPQGLALALRVCEFLNEECSKNCPNHADQASGYTLFAAASVQERAAALQTSVSQASVPWASASQDSIQQGALSQNVHWFPRLGDLVAQTFSSFSAHIFIAATGIVVRSIAPHLKSKAVDPAVLVLDQQGAHVISLLSGHLGGANRMAEALATAIGARPVITTATDVESLPALDVIAQERGLGIVNLSAMKHVSAALLAGERILLDDPQHLLGIQGGPLERFFQPLSRAEILATSSPAVFVETAETVVRLLQSAPENREQARNGCGCDRENIVLLAPRIIYAGVGCKRDTPESAICEAVEAVCQPYGLAVVRELGSFEAKADEKGLLDFAARHRLPIRFFTANELEEYPVNAISSKANALFGVKGVCEPAALALTGKAGAGRLVSGKQACGFVTVALAVVDENTGAAPEVE